MRALALATAMTASCTAAAPAPSPASVEAAIEAATGFDAPLPEEPWRVGDRIVYSIRLEEGDRTRRWKVLVHVTGLESLRTDTFRYTLNLELEGKDESENEVISTHVLPAAIEVLAEGGEPERSTTGVPEAFLRSGMFGVCDEIAGFQRTNRTQPDRLQSEAWARGYGRAIMTLVGLFQVIREDDSLGTILWSVLDKPPLFSLVTHLGVDTDISCNLNDPKEVDPELPPPLDGLSAYAFPVSLALNGKPAMECLLWVVPPDPPLRLAGGIVRIEGNHPTANRRVIIELVGARLGRGPDEVQDGGTGTP